MPLYEYHCDKCDSNFDELKKIKNRMTEPCPKCEHTAELVMCPVTIDWRSGWDPDFPTLSSKWEKIQEAKGRDANAMKDSNNERYGGNYGTD